MAAKLTLSIEETIIDRAKALASKSGRSLSSIISEFLQSLIDSDKQQDQDVNTPVTSRLAGVLDLPEDYDYKEDYRNHLMQRNG